MPWGRERKFAVSEALAKFSPKSCSQFSLQRFALAHFFYIEMYRGRKEQPPPKAAPADTLPTKGQQWGADFAGTHWDCCFYQTTSSQLVKYKMTTLCWHSANYPHRGKSDPGTTLKCSVKGTGVIC